MKNTKLQQRSKIALETKEFFPTFYMAILVEFVAA